MEVNGQDPPVTIRTHRPGDLGYIVHRHGVLYCSEFNYPPSFEAVVARVAADFLENFDVAKDRCWIAERNETFLGSIMLVKHSVRPNTAKLRVLLVEPAARGLGVGKRLVRICIAFAKATGYHRIVLWTQNDLIAARELYKAEGFKLAEGESQPASFTPGGYSEDWELDLLSTCDNQL